MKSPPAPPPNPKARAGQIYRTPKGGYVVVEQVRSGGAFGLKYALWRHSDPEGRPQWGPISWDTLIPSTLTPDGCLSGPPAGYAYHAERTPGVLAALQAQKAQESAMSSNAPTPATSTANDNGKKHAEAKAPATKTNGNGKKHAAAPVPEKKKAAPAEKPKAAKKAAPAPKPKGRAHGAYPTLTPGTVIHKTYKGKELEPIKVTATGLTYKGEHFDDVHPLVTKIRGGLPCPGMYAYEFLALVPRRGAAKKEKAPEKEKAAKKAAEPKKAEPIKPLLKPKAAKKAAKKEKAS